MLTSFLYLFSVFCLFFCFLKIKKDNKTLNLIKWIFITFVIFFCFNSVLVFILSYIRIKSSLIIISIFNLLISSFIYFKLIYKKETQKYFIDKKDLIVVIILLIITTIIAIIRFGVPFSITYQTMDPGVHFQSALSFFKESTLLNFAQDSTTFNFETWRFASYTNLGLIFKVISPFVSESGFYNMYILFDLATLFMTGILFYYAINNLKLNRIFYLIATIIFILGYPLNNLFIGFFYVGHASLIIITILILINELKGNNYLFSLVFILNLGLTFTYYLFLPVVFAAEFIYFIKTKKLIKKYCLIFGLPLLLGFLYFILPTFDNNAMNLINQTKIDGYFYNDVFGNSILFFPVICYYIYLKFKEKNLDIDSLMLIFLVLLMIALTVAMLMGIIMPYYVSKYYYILWILCFVLLIKTYNSYYFNNKLIFNIYSIFMAFIILMSWFDVENKIINLNEGEWNRTTPTMLFNVYRYNNKLINDAKISLDYKEVVGLKKEINAIDDKFMTNADPEKIFWLINFLDMDKIECPINQVYDCVEELYKGDFMTFVKDSNKRQYIFFDRSIYFPYYFSHESIDDILNISKKYNYNMKKVSFGYIIDKRM